jgi:hypothetical protein
MTRRKAGRIHFKNIPRIGAIDRFDSPAVEAGAVSPQAPNESP